MEVGAGKPTQPSTRTDSGGNVRPQGWAGNLRRDAGSSPGELAWLVGRRSGAGARVNLGGGQKPRKDRATSRWKRQVVATDSTTEQSPEVDVSFGTPRAARSGHGAHQEWERRDPASDPRGPSAGTHASVGEERQEGSRPRRRGAAVDEEHPSRGTVRRGERLRPGNATNPRVGSRVQQTCDLRAEKAVEAVRDREDGTGLRAWQLEAEGRGGNVSSGSGRTGG